MDHTAKKPKVSDEVAHALSRGAAAEAANGADAICTHSNLTENHVCRK